MELNKLEQEIRQCISEDDELVEFFLAQKMPEIWLYFLIGPFAFLNYKQYYLAISRKGVWFHRMFAFGKIAESEFFSFEEIEGIHIRKGLLTRPLRFSFANGRKLNLKAQAKGGAKVPKFTELSESYLQSQAGAL